MSGESLSMQMMAQIEKMKKMVAQMDKDQSECLEKDTSKNYPMFQIKHLDLDQLEFNPINNYTQRIINEKYSELYGNDHCEFKIIMDRYDEIEGELIWSYSVENIARKLRRMRNTPFSH